MSIKQISIFLANKTGELSGVISFLASNGINLRAMSIADTMDFGLVRIITDDPETALKILADEGFSVRANDVLAVTIDDRPGGLATVLSIISEADVAIEYTYAFLSNKPGFASLIFRVDDNDKATRALTSAGIKVNTQDELF